MYGDSSLAGPWLYSGSPCHCIQSGGPTVKHVRIQWLQIFQSPSIHVALCSLVLIATVLFSKSFHLDDTCFSVWSVWSFTLVIRCLCSWIQLKSFRIVLTSSLNPCLNWVVWCEGEAPVGVCLPSVLCNLSSLVSRTSWKGFCCQLLPVFVHFPLLNSAWVKRCCLHTQCACTCIPSKTRWSEAIWQGLHARSVPWRY